MTLTIKLWIVCQLLIIQNISVNAGIIPSPVGANNTNQVMGYCKCVESAKCGPKPIIEFVNDENCRKRDEILCCLQNSNVPSALMLGKPSFTSEFPWMATISFERNRARSEIIGCGGSLIHPRVVLTAANCFSPDIDFTELVVRAGEWHGVVDSSVLQVRSVINAKIHPEYRAEYGINNLAILLLDEEMILNKYVGLAHLGNIDLGMLDSDHCLLTGWGSNQSDISSPKLKRIPMRLLANKPCLNKLKQTLHRPGSTLAKGLICATSEGSEHFCFGDEGGPLVCPYRGAYLQVGVASWHYKCGVQGLPDLFTDVTYFIDWIQTEMSRWNLVLHELD